MTPQILEYDVIVVGGGHAGIEAAYAAAKCGSRTLMVTLDTKKIGTMPCNPAVGGIGKGHIVFEVSALGGLMPQLCTKTYLQVRMLNTSRGPAVQGLRLQIDKYAYSALSQQMLAECPNLTLFSGTVETIELDSSSHEVVGVVLADGIKIRCSSVVVTTGTFLNGLTHIGQETKAAGRRGEAATTGLAQFFYSAGLKMGRLKTGTPPRLHRDSLDFSRMERQESDNLTALFEFGPHAVENKRDCYITHTNAKTHEIIANNLHKSAMYSGAIKGIGPRYCPSIEDKIGRFPSKTSHHVFVEPEGLDTCEIYPNGLSTSLPREVQEQYIRSIVGFEQAEIIHYGYAVEYDFVLPNQLHETLELKTIGGLFLAGQINGTTGYEEAAGQGIVAGINAHCRAAGKPPFILDRTSSYIGVMINDLITMGVDEPYRMFTSRAERRLILRQDNVFLRLMPLAHELGMIDAQTYEAFLAEKEGIEQALQFLRSQGKNKVEVLHLFGENVDSVRQALAQAGMQLSDRAILNVHAEIRYAPYIEREQLEIKRHQQYQKMQIPDDLSCDAVPGLSIELKEKLRRYKPASIADAALIPGMTPAAIRLLILTVRAHYRKKGVE